MKTYNSDYYTGLGDELATELLGTREAHASLKEIQQEIDSRRSRIKQIKELISDKETELDELKTNVTELKQRLESAKAAIELAKDDEEATEAALADYNKVIEEGKKTEEEIEKISDSLGKLKEELEELELEEAEYLKSESNKKPSKKGKKSSKAPKSRRRKKSDPDDEPLDDDAEPDEAADDAAEPDADLLNQKAVEAFANALLGDEEISEEESEEETTEEQTESAPEEKSKETCESADFSVRGHVVPRTVVIKEERNMIVRTVNDLEFYNNLGKDALDFDRGKGMTGSLREWIKSAIADDEEISDVVVEQILPEILSADPDMIDLVKNILIAAEESAVPFIPVFVSRIDGTRFYDKSDAEGSIAQLTRAGVTTFEKVFEVKHQLAELEGVEDAPFVEESEVENFIKAFDGDRDQLRQRLFIKKPEKPGKKDSAKSNKDEA